MTKRRLYVIYEGKNEGLVRGPNLAQCIRHVARRSITGHVASADDVERLLNAKVIVEEVGDDEPVPPAV